MYLLYKSMMIFVPVSAAVGEVMLKITLELPATALVLSEPSGPYRRVVSAQPTGRDYKLVLIPILNGVFVWD